MCVLIKFEAWTGNRPSFRHFVKYMFVKSVTVRNAARVRVRADSHVKGYETDTEPKRNHIKVVTENEHLSLGVAQTSDLLLSTL